MTDNNCINLLACTARIGDFWIVYTFRLCEFREDFIFRFLSIFDRIEFSQCARGVASKGSLVREKRSKRKILFRSKYGAPRYPVRQIPPAVSPWTSHHFDLSCATTYTFGEKRMTNEIRETPKLKHRYIDDQLFISNIHSTALTKQLILFVFKLKTINSTWKRSATVRKWRKRQNFWTKTTKKRIKLWFFLFCLFFIG